MLPNGIARHFVTRAAPSPRALRGCFGSLFFNTNFTNVANYANCLVSPGRVNLLGKVGKPGNFGEFSRNMLTNRGKVYFLIILLSLTIVQLSSTIVPLSCVVIVFTQC